MHYETTSKAYETGSHVAHDNAIGLPQVFNCATLARYLEVDLKTVQALAQQGKIPCRKVGKAYRFFAPAVVKWLLGPHAGLLEQP